MADVQVLETSAVPSDLLARVRPLLDEAFRGTFTDDDWEHCLGGWHVLAVEDGSPLAHAAVVPRTLETAGRQWRCGYVEGVGVARSRQRTGLGSEVLRRVDEVVRARFELGALWGEVPPFYLRHGWEHWDGPTYAHRGGRRVRTAEDDAGIMVLRFGPSRDLPLTGALTCDERTGDAW